MTSHLLARLEVGLAATIAGLAVAILVLVLVKCCSPVESGLIRVITGA